MEQIKNYPISIKEVIRAGSIVHKYIKPTQLIYYPGLSKVLQAEVYIKHENHNPTGCFKIRGGVNIMHHLKQSGIKGVITFSTGNHGLSVAASAEMFGLDATIVVPFGNNPAKNRLIVERGAKLIEHGTTFEEAAAIVEKLCRENNLYYIHPADEPHLINGVGTEFIEILEELPDLDAVIVPIGGGSEAAAAVTVLHAVNSDIKIIAVHSESSQAAFKSWMTKKICSDANKTFAGGFATGKAYDIPFSIYKDSLEKFILLTEDEIYEAISMAFFYTHNMAEGAGASTIAAAFKLKEYLKGKKVVLQMSGCNASSEEIRIAAEKDSL